MERSSRLELLLEMIKNEPNDVFLNYAIALEYAVEPASYNKAEQLFKKVLDLDRNYFTAFYQLAQLCEKSNRIKEAIDLYKQGLEIAKVKNNNKAINEFNEAIFLLED